MKKTKEYRHARITAIEKASGITPMSDIFEAGYDFAMSRPRHIFDGVAVAGEVRRFEGKLVDVVDVSENEPSTCANCILFNVHAVADCSFLTGCSINDVKYIKR